MLPSPFLCFHTWRYIILPIQQDSFEYKTFNIAYKHDFCPKQAMKNVKWHPYQSTNPKIGISGKFLLILWRKYLFEIFEQRSASTEPKKYQVKWTVEPFLRYLEAISGYPFAVIKMLGIWLNMQSSVSRWNIACYTEPFVQNY